jgi:hypothetical protein
MELVLESYRRGGFETFTTKGSTNPTLNRIKRTSALLDRSSPKAHLESTDIASGRPTAEHLCHQVVDV